MLPWYWVTEENLSCLSKHASSSVLCVRPTQKCHRLTKIWRYFWLLQYSVEISMWRSSWAVFFFYLPFCVRFISKRAGCQRGGRSTSIHRKSDAGWLCWSYLLNLLCEGWWLFASEINFIPPAVELWVNTHTVPILFLFRVSKFCWVAWKFDQEYFSFAVTLPCLCTDSGCWKYVASFVSHCVTLRETC